MNSKCEIGNQTKRKIYYWNGILDPRGLGDNYGHIIEQLISGDYGLLDLEKLVGHNVYSIRINHSDRLLFTTISVNGEPYLMLLDEVLNHDYAKSRFLKPAVLKTYLELHGQPISEELVSSHFKAHKEASIPVSNNNTNNNSNQPAEFTRIDFYNQKFIELDATQLKTATKTPLPLIISGAPGSGKSCIALLILAQYVETNYDIEYPILYVTESENLANSMQQAWQALPVAQNLDAQAVQFKSYQQLLNDLNLSTQGLVVVGKEHCINWLEGYIKNYKKLAIALKEPLPDEDFFSNLETIYQEFRIISGCHDFKSYETQGQKQSLYHKPIEKKWLYAAFNCYQSELHSKKCIHAPFYPLTQKDQYKRIVVDEAQDFSPRQLSILANLACNKQICFCEDNRQNLSDNKSKIPFLKSLMHTWGVDENHIRLQTSYVARKKSLLWPIWYLDSNLL